MSLKQLFFWLLIFLSSLLYINVMYLTNRDEFSFLIAQISVLFLLMTGIYWIVNKEESSFIDFRNVQWSGIFLRIILLFHLPNLSDDFYRFLWDGHLTSTGINPYLFLPNELYGSFEESGHMSQLYNGMNSKGYYTVYPPVNQFIFAIAAKLFAQQIFWQVVFIKSLILGSELIGIFYLPRLLEMFSIHRKYALIYILNPLVIVEGVGNMHFEVLTVSFLILSLLLLYKGKSYIAAVLFGLAIGVKLIPFLILPLLVKYLGWVKGIVFSVLAFLSFFLMFLPFFDSSIFTNLFSSIDLYFRSFEFNASVYYLLRFLGFHLKGYNLIQSIGPILGCIVFLSIVLLSIKVRKDQFSSLLEMSFWAMLMFYLLSTTIHPWYIINLLFLSLFTKYRASIFLWTLLVFLSYEAYSDAVYKENFYLVGMEYSLFMATLLYQFFRSRKLEKTSDVK